MTNGYQPAKAVCPYCFAVMPPKSLAKHLKRKHPDAGPPPKFEGLPRLSKNKKRPFRQFTNHNQTETCPTCGKVMQARYLEGHLKLHEQAKMHPVKTMPAPPRVISVDFTKGTVSSASPEVKRSPAAPKGSTYRLIGTNKPYEPSSPSIGPIGWYRDSDGDLQLGRPPGKKRHKTRSSLSKGKIRDIPNPEPADKTAAASKKTLPSKENPQVTVVCPRCNVGVKKRRLEKHLLRHENLCPVCHLHVTRLDQHLKNMHELKLVDKLELLYNPAWEKRPTLICELCGEEVSVIDVRDHVITHKQVEKRSAAVTDRAKPTHLTTSFPKQRKVDQVAQCPICGKRMRAQWLKLHNWYEHQTCPYCQGVFSQRILNVHIRRRHPGKPVPKIQPLAGDIDA